MRRRDVAVNQEKQRGTEMGEGSSRRDLGWENQDWEVIEEDSFHQPLFTAGHAQMHVFFFCSLEISSMCSNSSKVLSFVSFPAVIKAGHTYLDHRKDVERAIYDRHNLLICLGNVFNQCLKSSLLIKGLSLSV